MKRVVVTGATSMIGAALIEECVKNDVEVLAIIRGRSTRLSRLPESKLVETVECSLDNLEFLNIQGKSYDVFYHFAWDYTSKQDRDNPILQEKNIKYTLDAVTLAKRLNCKKFIGAGSQAEYGKVDGVINENTPVNPSISYGMAKYAAGRLSEKLCNEYGMTHIWTRIFSVYGKYDNEGTMLLYAIDKFLKSEMAEFSAGTQMWDYLYETDAGRIFYELGKRICNNSVFRVANGESRPLKSYIEEVRGIFKETTQCVFDTSRNTALLGLEVDTKDLEAAIGYRPQVSFLEGIKEVVEYRRGLLNN